MLLLLMKESWDKPAAELQLSIRRSRFWARCREGIQELRCWVYHCLAMSTWQEILDQLEETNVCTILEWIFLTEKNENLPANENRWAWGFMFLDYTIKREGIVYKVHPSLVACCCSSLQTKIKEYKSIFGEEMSTWWTTSFPVIFMFLDYIFSSNDKLLLSSWPFQNLQEQWSTWIFLPP